MDSKIDLTRLTRKERRIYKYRTGLKVQGRNLGYVKKLHGTYENYCTMRAKEIEEDNKQLNGN